MLRRTAAVLCGTTGGLLSLKVWLDRNKAYGDASKNEPEQLKASDAELKLVNCQVFFRHGARTPLHHIPVEEVS